MGGSGTPPDKGRGYAAFNLYGRPNSQLIDTVLRALLSDGWQLVDSTSTSVLLEKNYGGAE